MSTESIEIKVFGFGGQGMVMAVQLLSVIMSKAGYQVQSFSSYGAERRGGRTESYVRLSKGKILSHSKVNKPDYLVLASDIFIKEPQIMSSVKDGGTILINCPSLPDNFSQEERDVAVVVMDVTSIAMKHGVQLPSGNPIINTTMLGALVALFPDVPFGHLAETLRERGIPAVGKNIKAAQEAYRQAKYGKKSEVIVETRDRKVTKILDRGYPVYQPEKTSHCERCMICYISCPDIAIIFEANPFSLAINRAFCKRCGICIQECRRKAISWEGEVE